ncbi:MAG: elongation factor G [Oligoflexia bacterium]|nr:elongation factor G [Oligoflexia bacterium]
MGMPIDKKRVVTVISPDGNGKTSIVKRLLGVKEDIPVEPEEEKRGYTLSSKTFVSEDKESEFAVIDTPGSLNYINDVINTIMVSNGAVYVLDATTGATDQGSRLWRRIKDYNVPTIIFVNMMDSDDADYDNSLESLRNVFKVSPLPIAIPVGKGTEFTGVINLITQKLYTYKDDSGKAKEEAIPEQYKELFDRYREKMVEAVVETDEKLMEKYFEGGEISDSELRSVLGRSVKNRSAFPVFVGSSQKNIGIDLLKNAFFYYYPAHNEFNAISFEDGETADTNPNAPFAGYVFKTKIDNYTGKTNYIKVVSGSINKSSKLTVANINSSLKISKIYKPLAGGLKAVEEASSGDIIVLDKCEELKTGHSVVDSSISKKILKSAPEPKRVLNYAVDVTDKKLEEKVAIALKKIIDEDPSIGYTRIPETKELVISGLGQLQMDVVKEMLKEKYKLDVIFRPPRIQYRETITKSVQVQGRHKKQSGGHGQFADTWIKAEPLSRNSGFEFVDAIVGGVIPRNFIPSVEKGIKKSMEKGTVAGYPVIDFKVTLYDGSHHSVDSSDMAFQIAGSIAYKKAMEEAGPILLEPIMNIRVSVPEEFVGSITNDLSGRRGRITGMDSNDEGSMVKAQVPLSELSSYAPELHSMTKGLGVFEMEFATYEELPSQFVNKIVDDTKKWRESEESAH